MATRAAHREISLLTRGTPSLRMVVKEPPGIIPACAGNTPIRGRWAGLCRDHPRLRGEHAMNDWAPAKFPGSSPLARGTLVHLELVITIAGIIPACAGNTPCARPFFARATDHPRLRGEHTREFLSRDALPGSSPLARGTQVEDVPAVAVVGIIPACAGNTSCRRTRPACRQDHPRLRGEHVIPSAVSQSDTGSSPLARGTRQETAIMG